MYELVSASQTNRWQEILNLFSISDIYYSYEYLVCALKLDPGDANLFYYIDDSGQGEIVYPFIRRQLSEENSIFYDITSPFGYGGPAVKVIGDAKKLVSRFLSAFSGYCKNEKIVTEYIRFHPLMHNAEFFKNEMKLIAVCDTYTLPLIFLKDKGDPDGNKEEEPRYIIKKLGTVKHMFDFLVLYYSTVRQNEDTDSYYFFTNDYFESLVSALGPNLHLFGAYKGNKLLTASYLFTKGEVIYHHLSGMSEDADQAEVQKEMLASIAEWGTEHNFRYLHIAGKQAATYKDSKTDKNETDDSAKSIYYIARQIHEPEIHKEHQPLDETELIKRYGNN